MPTQNEFNKTQRNRRLRKVTIMADVYADVHYALTTWLSLVHQSAKCAFFVFGLEQH